MANHPNRCEAPGAAAPFNAALIAAAPGLLAALEECVSQLHALRADIQHIEYRLPNERVNMVSVSLLKGRNAIKAAKGEA